MSVGTCCHYLQGTDRQYVLLKRWYSPLLRKKALALTADGAAPYLLGEALEREQRSCKKKKKKEKDVSDVLWLLFTECSTYNKPIESDMCIALPDGTLTYSLHGA